jgi:hypothetical protein
MSWVRIPSLTQSEPHVRGSVTGRAGDSGRRNSVSGMGADLAYLRHRRTGARKAQVTRQPRKVSRRTQRRQAERKQRQCLFCGSVGKLTEEHVFGDWLQKLGFTGPGLRELVEDADLKNRVLQEGHPFNKTLRIVCEDCNGGWMSKLETAAKSLLIQMFNTSGKVRLDEDSQITLARWAFKTACVLSQLGSRKTFPLAHCRELFDSERPSAHSQVWIGSAPVKITERGHHLAEWRYNPRIANLTYCNDTSKVFCYSARFRLINVVFDAFGHVPEGEFHLDAELSPDLRRALIPVWPSEHSAIWWPPITNLDTIGGVQGLAAAPLVGIPTFISTPGI